MLLLLRLRLLLLLLLVLHAALSPPMLPVLSCNLPTAAASACAEASAGATGDRLPTPQARRPSCPPSAQSAACGLAPLTASAGSLRPCRAPRC
eukprot:5886475-Alexandrium_andersonii.AAC.1